MKNRIEFYFSDPSVRSLVLHISDAALRQLLLSSLESYRVRQWGKVMTSNKGAVETAGLLWGHFNRDDEYDHVFVSEVSNDTYAKKTVNSNELNEDVTLLKQQLVKTRWPYLSMVGDFHTHPYDAKAIERGDSLDYVSKEGWKFSNGDYDWYETQKPDSWDGRVALVVTITEPKRNHDITPELIQNNVVKFGFGEFRIWISAYGIDVVDESSNFKVSPAVRKSQSLRQKVYIDAPTVFAIDSFYDYING